MVLTIVVLGPRYHANTDWPTFIGEEIPNFLFLVGTITLVWTKRYWVHAVIVSLMLGYTVWDYLPHGLA